MRSFFFWFEVVEKGNIQRRSMEWRGVDMGITRLEVCVFLLLWLANFSVSLGITAPSSKALGALIKGEKGEKN